MKVRELSAAVAELDQALGYYGRIHARLARALLHDVVVHGTEVELRLGIALLGGLAVPGHRLLLVLCHALAFFVHETEVELRSGIALLGGRPEFPQRRRVILPVVRGQWA